MMEDFIQLGTHTVVRIDALKEVAIINNVLHVVTEDNRYTVEDEVEAAYAQVIQYLNIVEELV